MKRFVVLLFSLSLVVMFASTKDVSVQKSSEDVAYGFQPTDHPIQPPIG